MPFPNYIGSHKRFWTRENVIKGLQLAANEIQGPLPCCDRTYNRIKKGRLKWPTSRRVLELFGSMARGWLEAGCAIKRVSMNNLEWTEDEVEYLLTWAGKKKLTIIAGYLRRSYGSVRRKLYSLETKARDNQGFLSAAEISKEYNCSYDRVLRLLSAGRIPGKRSRIRNEWLIDPGDIDDRILEILNNPKITHRDTPLDRADYERRHGLIRKNLNGKVVRIKEFV